MTSTNTPEAPQRVGKTEPSRPGMKFMLCVIGAAVALTVLLLRN